MNAQEFKELYEADNLYKLAENGVEVTGIDAKEIIEFYLSQKPSCDWLPKSEKFYAYGKGGITIEYPKSREYVLIGCAEHIS